MPSDTGLVLDRPGVTPGTHALVIGVGAYPHLSGGDGALSRYADGMQQLGSPPVSARAVADWLKDEYRFPAKPLASLSVLLSESGHAGALADSGTVMRAIVDWKQRASTDPQNRLIFYFCGHGISQGEDMALLMSDFGASDDNPFNGALDFRKLLGGLKRCMANEQIFFVDACRASSDLMIEQFDGIAGAVPVLPGSRPPDYGPRLPATYYSTLVGAGSYARPGEVSLFTGALLKSLQGAGSDNSYGDWRIDTASLQKALNHFLGEKSFAGRMAGAQVPNASLATFDLHRLDSRPVVPVYVGCQKPEENGRAEFECRNQTLVQAREPTGRDDEWVIDLDADTYEFRATLTPIDVRTEERAVRPVFARVVLEPQS